MEDIESTTLSLLIEELMKDLFGNHFDMCRSEILFDFDNFWSDAKEYILLNSEISRKDINWFYDTYINGSNVNNMNKIYEGLKELKNVLAEK